MKSVNCQVWLSASQVAQLALYMEQTGDNSRRLADTLRIAVDMASAILDKQGIKAPDEAEAIRYLDRRGFRLLTNLDKRKRVVKALQAEALADSDNISDEARAKLEKMLLQSEEE